MRHKRKKRLVTFKRRIAFMLSMFAFLFCTACGSAGNSSKADGDRDTPTDLELENDDSENEEFDPITVLIQASPQAFEFRYGDKLMTALAEAGRSGLYLFNDKTKVRTNLSGSPQESEENGTHRLVYVLEDGRQAQIGVETAGPGAARIQFKVEGKTEDERYGATFHVGENEGFYGVMERVVQGSQELSWKEDQTQGLNLRGLDVEFIIKPTLSIYSPFFVSSAGYGVYAETTWPGLYRFGTEADDTVSMEFEGETLTLWVLPGANPIEVTERYSELIGKALKPPRWAFAPWRWRDNIYDLSAFYDGTPYDGPYNSMVVEDILMMQALGIPCSLYWVDRPWAQGSFGYSDFLWDETRLPNPQSMISWLDDKGIKFMLWIAPWAVGQMAKEAEEKGYVVEDALGFPTDAPLLDLSNQDAVEWWQEHLAKLIGQGVAGFKLDRGDEKPPDGKLISGFYDDGTSYRQGHNAFPTWYAKAVHDAFVREGASEFVVMARPGFSGSQQWSMNWGGDTAPTPWGLRAGIIAAQRTAVMNFPFWGTDTCGYGLSDRETCMRWLAFSAFTPLMEVGPTGDVAPWSMPPEGTRGTLVDESGYHYEPNYDTELLAVWNLYANLHNNLIDYTEIQAGRAATHGTPIIRPMIFAHPDRPEYLDLFSQYYYGPDILVAPIWRVAQYETDVVLPPGNWIDAWTGKSVKGDQTLRIVTPKHKMPIYWRKDSGIRIEPLQDLWERAKRKVQAKPDLASLAQTVR